jgi:dCTP deaminase
MSILSDSDIINNISTGLIEISDFDPDNLQPATYDVHLGNEFLTFDYDKIPYIDPRISYADRMIKHTIQDGRVFILEPNGFALGVVKEKVGSPGNIATEILGKSSLARLGLLIHATAGFIDPGNVLNITLEFYNLTPKPFLLIPGMKIAQIMFSHLTSPCDRLYGDTSLGSKYEGSTGVEASRMDKNFTSLAELHPDDRSQLERYLFDS